MQFGGILSRQEIVKNKLNVGNTCLMSIFLGRRPIIVLHDHGWKYIFTS